MRNDRYGDRDFKIIKRVQRRAFLIPRVINNNADAGFGSDNPIHLNRSERPTRIETGINRSQTGLFLRIHGLNQLRAQRNCGLD